MFLEFMHVFLHSRTYQQTFTVEQKRPHLFFCRNIHFELQKMDVREGLNQLFKIQFSQRLETTQGKRLHTPIPTPRATCPSNLKFPKICLKQICIPPQTRETSILSRIHPRRPSLLLQGFHRGPSSLARIHLEATGMLNLLS